MEKKIENMKDVNKFKEMMIGRIFVRHIQNHLTKHRVVVCKICDKDIDTIVSEERDKK